MIQKNTYFELKSPDQPRHYFTDTAKGRKYRRIHGGMQWGGSKPGAVVAIAEDWDEDFQLNERKLWILGEFEHQNQSDLLNRCEELKVSMKVETYYGDTTNKPMMTMYERHKPQFCLVKAPFVDEPNAHDCYLNLVREKASASKKVLGFDGHKKLPAILATIDSITSMSSLKTDHPMVAALAYALSSLIVHEPIKPIHYVNPYDQPLDPWVGY